MSFTAEYFWILDRPLKVYEEMHSLFSVEYERAVIHIRAVTSGASCRLDSWCSYRMCAFGSYADWPWLSLA